MNISLRKANAIQKRITEVLNNIKIETIIDLNEFEDPAKVLYLANEQLFANDARRQKLLFAFYNVRGLVGAANATCGIDISLTKAAFLEKRIVQLQMLSNASAVKSLDVIKGQLEKLKSAADSRSLYGREDTVSTSIISQVQIEQAHQEILNLRKQKQQIDDTVLELNVKTEIPLSDDVVQTLQSEGLL
jgi:hypothetical protein